jgi:hypothetical protein
VESLFEQMTRISRTGVPEPIYRERASIDFLSERRIETLENQNARLLDKINSNDVEIERLKKTITPAPARRLFDENGKRLNKISDNQNK